MAGDVPPIDPAHFSLIGWLSGLATATVGATGLWLAQRVLGMAAFQTAINDGFSKLTSDLQEERDGLLKSIKEERSAWQAERVSWAQERSRLTGEIINLRQTVTGLTNQLRALGGAVPDDASTVADAEPGATIL